MGMVSWFRGLTRRRTREEQHQGQAAAAPEPPVDLTIISIGTAEDNVTLSGFCPVSDKLEPCTWKILPAPEPDSAKIRIAF